MEATLPEAALKAVVNNDAPALQACLANGFSVDQDPAEGGETLLHVACTFDAVAAVEVLLQHGWARHLNTFPPQSGMAPLHTAARWGRCTLAKLLLQHGAMVNGINDSVIGDTPLTEAVREGHEEMIALLMQAGADPTIPGWCLRSALDHARERLVKQPSSRIGRAPSARGSKARKILQLLEKPRFKRP